MICRGPSVGNPIERTVAAAVVIALAPFLFPCALDSSAAQPEPVEPKGAEPRKDYPEEYHPTLKDNAKPIPDLLVYGPDAPECVKFEPAGLRITLPLGYPKPRPGTGVVTDFGVKGDFEITIAFEILPSEGPPANYSNLRIMIVPNERAAPEIWHKASQNRAGLAREIIGRNGAGRFFANATVNGIPKFRANKWGNEDFSGIEPQTFKRLATTAAAQAAGFASCAAAPPCSFWAARMLTRISRFSTRANSAPGT